MPHLQQVERMQKKGQGGIEAMILIGVLMVVFLGVYLVYQAKNRAVLRVGQEIEERENCFQLANALTTIFVLGDTAQLTIRTAYEVSIDPQQQRIQSARAFCTFPMPTVISGSSSQPFSLPQGKITIRNEQGEVHVQHE